MNSDFSLSQKLGAVHRRIRPGQLRLSFPFRAGRVQRGLEICDHPASNRNSTPKGNVVSQFPSSSLPPSWNRFHPALPTYPIVQRPVVTYPERGVVRGEPVRARPLWPTIGRIEVEPAPSPGRPYIGRPMPSDPALVDVGRPARTPAAPIADARPWWMTLFGVRGKIEGPSIEPTSSQVIPGLVGSVATGVVDIGNRGGDAFKFEGSLPNFQIDDTGVSVALISGGAELSSDIAGGRTVVGAEVGVDLSTHLWTGQQGRWGGEFAGIGGSVTIGNKGNNCVSVGTPLFEPKVCANDGFFAGIRNFLSNLF